MTTPNPQERERSIEFAVKLGATSANVVAVADKIAQYIANGKEEDKK